LDISQEERRVTSRKVILLFTVSRLTPSEIKSTFDWSKSHYVSEQLGIGFLNVSVLQNEFRTDLNLIDSPESIWQSAVKTGIKNWPA